MAMYYTQMLRETDHEREINSCNSSRRGAVPYTEIKRAIDCGKTVYCHALEPGTNRVLSDVVKEGFDLNDFLVFAGDSRNYLFSLTPNPHYA